jgi:hypothetical protein
MMGDRAATGCGRRDEDEMQRIAQLMEQLGEINYQKIYCLEQLLGYHIIISISGPSNNLSN